MSTPFDSGAATPSPGALPSLPDGQTVADALRDTAFAPLLDSPVADVLSTLGLPALPQLPAFPPLPELPPLPTLDLTALTKPLTDLASSFGTGQLGQGLDASNMLSGVSSALQQIMSIAQSISSLAGSNSWQGDGATGAAEKGAAAQGNAVELETQNVQQKTVMGGAAASVATGAATMSAIITKFVTGVTLAAPFIATPPGQAFLLSLASETGAEATATVAKTRTEMTVHSATMTAAGQKVKVTDAPKGVDPMSQVSQLLSMISPLGTAASTGAQTIQQLQSISQTSEAPLTPVAEPVAAATDTSVFTGGGLMPMSGLPTISTPLAPAGPRAMSATPVAAESTTPTVVPASTGSGMGGGMVPPMGAGGMSAGAGAGDADEEVRTQLVTAEHGDEVVGELGHTGVAVVGAVGTNGPRPAS